MDEPLCRTVRHYLAKLKCCVPMIQIPFSALLPAGSPAGVDRRPVRQSERPSSPKARQQEKRTDDV